MATVDEFLARLGRYMLALHRKDVAQYTFARIVTEHLKRSADESRAEQFRLLSEMVAYAYANSPFYNRRFREVGFEPGDLKDFSDLAKLPELTKTDLRDHVDEMVSTAVSPDEITKSVSGGTTGIPVTFYRDSYCLHYRWGVDLALARYYGWREGQWQGLLWGAPRDVVIRKSWREKFVQYWADRVFALDAWHLSDKAYEDFAAQVNKYHPTFVLAYPSLAYDLARRVEAGKVQPVRIPVINVTAEPLYDFQREKIEAVIADNVYARYGAREFGTAAFECPRKEGLHILTDSVYLEVVPQEEGDDAGVVLVTDLLNKAMPLIRYRVGDLGKLDYSPCSCGLHTPRLRQVQGRETDIIWRPDGTGFPGTEIVTLVGEAGLHTKVQVVQEALDEIIIRIEGDPDAHRQELSHLLEGLRRNVGEEFSYRVEPVEEIKRARSGKYRYVISNVERPEEN